MLRNQETNTAAESPATDAKDTKSEVATTDCCEERASEFDGDSAEQYVGDGPDVVAAGCCDGFVVVSPRSKSSCDARS